MGWNFGDAPEGGVEIETVAEETPVAQEAPVVEEAVAVAEAPTEVVAEAVAEETPQA